MKVSRESCIVKTGIIYANTTGAKSWRSTAYSQHAVFKTMGCRMVFSMWCCTLLPLSQLMTEGRSTDPSFGLKSGAEI